MAEEIELLSEDSITVEQIKEFIENFLIEVQGMFPSISILARVLVTVNSQTLGGDRTKLIYIDSEKLEQFNHELNRYSNIIRNWIYSDQEIPELTLISTALKFFYQHNILTNAEIINLLDVLVDSDGILDETKRVICQMLELDDEAEVTALDHRSEDKTDLEILEYLKNTFGDDIAKVITADSSSLTDNFENQEYIEYILNNHERLLFSIIANLNREKMTCLQFLNIVWFVIYVAATHLESQFAGNIRNLQLVPLTVLIAALYGTVSHASCIPQNIREVVFQFLSKNNNSRRALEIFSRNTFAVLNDIEIPEESTTEDIIRLWTTVLADFQLPPPPAEANPSALQQTAITPPLSIKRNLFSSRWVQGGLGILGSGILGGIIYQLEKTPEEPQAMMVASDALTSSPTPESAPTPTSAEKKKDNKPSLTKKEWQRLMAKFEETYQASNPRKEEQRFNFITANGVNGEIIVLRNSQGFSCLITLETNPPTRTVIHLVMPKLMAFL